MDFEYSEDVEDLYMPSRCLTFISLNLYNVFKWKIVIGVINEMRKNVYFCIWNMFVAYVVADI